LQHHISADDLEALAFGHHLGSVKQAEVEAHLLICGSCRSHLVREESITETIRTAFIACIASHATTDGTVELWLERTGDRWLGKIESQVVRSCCSETKWEKALASVEQAFREMFPEHTCSAHCSSSVE
jgi:hypothetical protein